MVKNTEPEEYEVQFINSHKIVYTGKKRTPALQYEVKWKGYSSSDNTWESSESTENAKDLVDMYWKTKGGGKAAREQVERILRGGKSEEESSDSEVEEEESESSEDEGYNSRKRVSSPINSRTNNKRAKKSDKEDNNKPKKVAVEEESDNESDISESEIEKGDFRAKSNNWKTDVEKIISVRPNQNNNNELYATVRWRDGKIGMNKTSVVAQKNPQILIKYYEKRLAFERKD